MFLRVSFICLLLCLMVAGQNPKASRSAAAGKTAESDSPKFAALSDQFMKESLALSPISASYAGYHKHKDAKTGKVLELDALLDDVSAAAYKQQRAFYGGWLAKFAKLPAASLSAQDKADLRLIQDQIALNLLELDEVQNYKHNPTVFVEAIGNAIFLPLSQEYAPKSVRLGHVLARIEQIPRFLEQTKHVLADSDPIFVKVAAEENDGNVDMIENMVKEELPADAKLKQQYDDAAPKAIAALKAFNAWLADDLGKRKTDRTWRLGQPWYDRKFKYVMETPVTPAQVLADAEQQMKAVRAEMLELALPMHQQWFAEHGAHDDLAGRDRENKIVGEVLQKISDEHAGRDQLADNVKRDLAMIKQFIIEKKIVSMGPRDNLKVIPTPPFMRGIYSVAGFHSAPPLEPTAEAQYWVTPIDAKMPAARAESKLREYNDYTLKWLSIHEALPGHYVQFEHANNVQPERRRLLRNLLGNGCYVEGWAEYIAQVMMDSGFPPGDDLGRTKYRLMMRKLRLRLLANTILDVRMQTMNMTDAQAMELMTKDAFQTQAEADGKLQRAKLSSTQLPTYYVGYRDWMSLREDYQKAHASDFDMRKYHDMVLDLGPLPIDAVRAIVLPAAAKR
ncbi:MAG: DUF885 domain-containing protein [Candidatus Koribacter versatilis]|uniref:DUF885 domain-containing protein n=1 Tax=Candidatus Korobacter versatilis TaxID=658062 RepID=A0A932A8Q4_9BACT|nr:DUF885 domain-containing protein [Candidatus Koribacter versatilis]